MRLIDQQQDVALQHNLDSFRLWKVIDQLQTVGSFPLKLIELPHRVIALAANKLRLNSTTKASIAIKHLKKVLSSDRVEKEQQGKQAGCKDQGEA